MLLPRVCFLGKVRERQDNERQETTMIIITIIMEMMITMIMEIIMIMIIVVVILVIIIKVIIIITVRSY